MEHLWDVLLGDTSTRALNTVRAVLRVLIVGVLGTGAIIAVEIIGLDGEVRYFAESAIIGSIWVWGILLGVKSRSTSGLHR